MVEIYTGKFFTDGSEDGDIHCLKLGEVAAEAVPEIARLTVSLS